MKTKEKKYYVTMTDKFMSGWGQAEGRINKLVFECDTYEEALIILENAKERSDMQRVTICKTKPRYNVNKYFVQDKTDTSTSWYTKDFFKNKKRN